jgi:hypothetical protein
MQMNAMQMNAMQMNAMQMPQEERATGQPVTAQPAAAAQPARVGVVNWMPNDSLAAPYSAALRAAGYAVSDILHTDPLPAGLDALLVYGPMGSLTPLANQLLARPPAERPALIFVMTEQLPNPGLPEWWRQGVGRLRSGLERLAHQPTGAGTWRRRCGFARLLRFGHRYRYYGDLFWLRKSGLLTVLAVYSAWTAGFLRQRGFAPVAAPRSQNNNWGEDLGLARDIPVLWLGKAGSRRRRRLLARLRRTLRGRGVEMMVVDGVEHPYVFGHQRTVLLNRTKIVLNLLREKWDDNSMRFPLAACNGALFVSEPTMPHVPEWEPGVHLVEAPYDQLAATIYYYLDHEEERQRIAEQARRLVHAGTQRRGVVELVEQALATRMPAVRPRNAPDPAARSTGHVPPA